MPTLLPGGTPEQNERGNNEIARYIAQPPRQPDGVVAAPIRKAREGKTGHTKSGTDQRADRCCNRKLEDTLRTITKIPAIPEAID